MLSYKAWLAIFERRVRIDDKVALSVHQVIFASRHSEGNGKTSYTTTRGNSHSREVLENHVVHLVVVQERKRVHPVRSTAHLRDVRVDAHRPQCGLEDGVIRRIHFLE